MNTHIFGILFLAWLQAAYGEDEGPCGNSADIAFILDSSRSIYFKDFDIEKMFVQKLVDQFDLSPEKTQVAALQFARDVMIEFRLNQYSNNADAVRRVGQIEQSNGGSTYINKALSTMRTDIFDPSHGARKNVPKIGILLSDGASTDKNLTQVEAKQAKEAGITLLAVGIGKVNKKELEAMVTAPASENFFYVSDFSQLENVHFQKLVGQQACKVIPTTTTTTEATTTTTTEITTPETLVSTTTGMSKDEPSKSCQGKAADVVFVLDMSSSIWTEDFRAQLQFVSKLIDVFDVDSRKTQVGALVFSDNASVVFDLDEYNNKADITKAVLGIKSEGGITNTHKALDLVVNRMFTPEYGARPDVAHICILITDGRSSVPAETYKSVEQVHKRGIYLFAIGVGNMTDATELAQMASRPTEEYMFEVNGYKALPKIRDILAFKTCEVPQGDQPRCVETIQADLVFGLYNIGGEYRDNVATFIKSVGGGFDLSSGNVRIGLTENCGSASFDLTDFNTNEEYYGIVEESMAMELGDFLYNVRKMFGPSSMKSSINKVAVLIVSGDVPLSDKAIAEARRLKFFSRVVVVGIGDDVKAEQLKLLASYKDTNVVDDSHVLMIKQISGLPFSIKQLYELMCTGQ